MAIVRTIILSGVVVLAAIIAVTFIREYREASARSRASATRYAGSTWQRLLEASRDSATILVQKCAILTSGIGSLAALLGEWLDMPGLKDAVQAALKPEYVLAFVVATALVSWFARKRTLPGA